MIEPSTKGVVALLIGTAIVAGVAACSDTSRARMERTFTDKPSTITCVHYGEVLYQGRSKGKIESDENGRLTFTDAADNKLTAVEGECIVKYDR